MKSHFGMNLEGEVKCCCKFRQYDTLALGCEGHDIVIIERCGDTIHIVHLIGMISYVFEYILELLEPCLYVCLGTFGCTSEAIVAYHTLR